MTVVIGIDSSTQSSKAIAVDAASGQVLAEGRAAHPDGTEVHPEAWWRAPQLGVGRATAGLSDPVRGIAVAGQQHGMVTLDDRGEVVRPALLWNDNRSAPQARRLTDELGGPTRWAERTGSVPVAGFTVS